MQFWKQQYSDAPGRVITLASLVVVLLVIGVVQLVRMPSSAKATPTSPSTLAGAGVEPAGPGAAKAGMAFPMPTSPVPGVQPFGASQSGSSQRVALPSAAELERHPMPTLPRHLARDLFTLEWSRYLPEEPLTVVNKEEQDEEPQSKREPVELILEATFHVDKPAEAPMAVINGLTVHVGDQLAGMEIQEIGERFVVLFDGQQQLLLRMRLAHE
jgi:hypothetical protein